MAVSRLIFVGIHNKPGKKPLCISTKTGKIVDEIAQHFANQIGFFGGEIVKTNLYNIDRKPEAAGHAAILVTDFFFRHRFTESDVVVLLGKDVQTVLNRINTPYVVNLNHPSSVYGAEKKRIYIQEAITAISQVQLPF